MLGALTVVLRLQSGAVVLAPRGGRVVMRAATTAGRSLLVRRRDVLLRRKTRNLDQLRNPPQVVAVDEDTRIGVEEANDLAVLHHSRQQRHPHFAGVGRAVHEVLHRPVLQTARVVEARGLTNDWQLLRHLLAHQLGRTLARLGVADGLAVDLDRTNIHVGDVLGLGPALDVRPVETGRTLALVDCLGVPVEVVALDAVDQGGPVHQHGAEPGRQTRGSHRVTGRVGRRDVARFLHDRENPPLPVVLDRCLAVVSRLRVLRGRRIGCGRARGSGGGGRRRRSRRRLG